MKIFTIGYGGRSQNELTDLLKQNSVRTVVDVRLRPDRASMGIWAKAKTSDKGIEKTLTEEGIEYRSLIELGNIFLDFPDWQERYTRLLDQAGDLLLDGLTDAPRPFCLLCAEKQEADCHRKIIADYLVCTQGSVVKHL